MIQIAKRKSIKKTIKKKENKIYQKDIQRDDFILVGNTIEHIADNAKNHKKEIFYFITSLKVSQEEVNENIKDIFKDYKVNYVDVPYIHNENQILFIYHIPTKTFYIDTNNIRDNIETIGQLIILRNKLKIYMKIQESYFCCGMKEIGNFNIPYEMIDVYNIFEISIKLLLLASKIFICTTIPSQTVINLFLKKLPQAINVITKINSNSKNEVTLWTLQ